jgi:hypothetical protein
MIYIGIREKAFYNLCFGCTSALNFSDLNPKWLVASILSGSDCQVSSTVALTFPLWAIAHFSSTNDAVLILYFRYIFTCVLS